MSSSPPAGSTATASGPPGRLHGRPIDDYRGDCIEGRAFQVMIDNNLDFEVALYPYELVTYGETGQVCQNWMQYRLIKRYLEVLTREQTLVVASGHPLGLFSLLTRGPAGDHHQRPDGWAVSTTRNTGTGPRPWGSPTTGR